jgi:exopolysaccharide production protein ExoQ
MAMDRRSSRTSIEQAILIFAFLLANLRATIFIYLYPDPSVPWGPAWIEIALWIFITLAVGYDLSRNDQVGAYLSLWRRNWLLALFILLAFVSALWSIGPAVTLFRSLELLFASLVAAYFGMRLDPERMMDGLFWFGTILFILSIALVFGAPPTGTMYWPPFNGAWRGVYWHRNHLASITALLSIVYLCRMLLAFRDRNPKGVLDGFFYLLSLAILYFARSAAGYILLIVLHGFVFVAWIWLQIAQRLHRRHYLIILGIAVLSAILILSNLDVLFGLFHRDTTLTGRVGLWSHLLDIGFRRPWLGHGFGAVWTFESFREEIKGLARWSAQPLIADNGLLDIFLHLGMIGVLSFLGVLALLTIRSVRYALAGKTLAGFFPLLIVVYAIFANISFSLLAESEVFVWSLLVAALFMATPPSRVMGPSELT